MKGGKRWERDVEERWGGAGDSYGDGALLSGPPRCIDPLMDDAPDLELEHRQ